jgi:hypothetical protein
MGLSGQPIAVVWQIDLQLVDLNFLPISTEANLGTAIAKVRSLAFSYSYFSRFIQKKRIIGEIV